MVRWHFLSMTLALLQAETCNEYGSLVFPCNQAQVQKQEVHQCLAVNGPNCCFLDDRQKLNVSTTENPQSVYPKCADVKAKTPVGGPEFKVTASPTNAPSGPPEVANKNVSPTTPKEESNSGAIIGASIGGLVAVALVAFAFVHYRRRNGVPKNINQDADLEEVDAYLMMLTPRKEAESPPPLTSRDEMPLMDGNPSSFASVDLMAQPTSDTKSKTPKSLRETLSTREDLKPHWLPYESLKVTPLKGGFLDLRVVQHDGRKVVVRCLEYSMVSSARRKSFIQAFHAIKSLQHEHLTRVLGVSLVSHQTELCIATEYMERGSLGAILINAGVELSFSDRMQMALNVAKALEYLHSKDVVYGGVHPDKILLNGSLECKLNSYYLMKPMYEARSICPASCGNGLTSYLAPELRGVHASAPSKESDVYAFGVVLSFLLTRMVPHAQLIHEIGFVHADAYLHQNPACLPHQLPADTPEDIVKLVNSCWHVDPASRPRMDAIVGVLQTVEIV